MAKAFVHIKQHGLVYARVPKVANSSIKACLARLVDVSPVEGLKPTNDRFWRECAGDQAELISAKDYTARRDELFSFTFIREPKDRLFSCYANKIVANGAVHGFAERGYRPDMTFDDFVAHTCSLPVAEMNVHTQPQWFLITDAEHRPPDFIGVLERVKRDWRRLEGGMKRRGLPTLGRLPVKNSHKHSREGLSDDLTATTTAQLRDVYRRGFELHEELMALEV